MWQCTMNRVGYDVLPDQYETDGCVTPKQNSAIAFEKKRLCYNLIYITCNKDTDA